MAYAKANCAKSYLPVPNRIRKFAASFGNTVYEDGMTLSSFAAAVFSAMRTHYEARMHEKRNIPEQDAEHHPWTHGNFKKMLACFNTILRNYRDVGRIEYYTPIRFKWSASPKAIQHRMLREESRYSCPVTRRTMEKMVLNARAKSPRFAFALHLMSAFGLRGDDVQDLKRASFVHIEDRRHNYGSGWFLLTTGKIGKKRGMPLKHPMSDREAAAYLAAMDAIGIVDEDEYILCQHRRGEKLPTGDGYEMIPVPEKRISYMTFRNWFLWVCGESGVTLPPGVCTHVIRISVVTDLKQKGFSDSDIAKYVGMHPNTVPRYDKAEMPSRTPSHNLASIDAITNFLK